MNMILFHRWNDWFAHIIFWEVWRQAMLWKRFKTVFAYPTRCNRNGQILWENLWNDFFWKFCETPEKCKILICKHSTSYIKYTFKKINNHSFSGSWREQAYLLEFSKQAYGQTPFHNIRRKSATCSRINPIFREMFCPFHRIFADCDTSIWQLCVDGLSNLLGIVVGNVK